MQRPDFARVNEISTTAQITSFATVVRNYSSKFIDIFMKHQKSKGIDLVYSGKLVVELMDEMMKDTRSELEKKPSSPSGALLPKQGVIKDRLGEIALRHAIANDDMELIKKLDDLEVDVMYLENDTSIQDLLDAHPRSRQVADFIKGKEDEFDECMASIWSIPSKIDAIEQESRERSQQLTTETRGRQRALFATAMQAAADISSRPQTALDALEDLQRDHQQKQREVLLSAMDERSSYFSIGRAYFKGLSFSNRSDSCCNTPSFS